VVKDAPSPRQWPRRVLQVLLGVTCAGLTVAGVMAVGNAARQSLGPEDRYLLPFFEIECPKPPNQDPLEFMGEVQYSGQFSDKVNVLDPMLPDRLRSAFARHPRVERVGRITILAPRRIIVELTFTH
jgi:hypothetical protein